MNKEIKITDLMYCAYGTDTGILFGIPADLRGSVETIVKIAIADSEIKAERDRLREALQDIASTEAVLSEQLGDELLLEGTVRKIIRIACAALAKHEPVEGKETKNDQT